MLIPFNKLQPLFDKIPVTGAIHLGAHKAEELEGYHTCGITRIIWVEANVALAFDLLDRTVNHLGSTVVFCAAFDKDYEVLELNVANNGESSSLLKFDEHSNEHPDIHYLGTTPVWGIRVDTLLEEKGFRREAFNFANIDLQGAELLALKGMEEQLKFLDYVYLEVNIKHLYEGCPLLPEIDQFLRDRGFEQKMIEMTKHGWGDALYVRKT
jgi:FkbM family methyltransferase